MPGKLSADLYPGRLKCILCSDRRRAVHLFDCQLADYHARRSRSLVYCLWMKLRQTPKLTRKVTAGCHLNFVVLAVIDHVQTMRRTCECGLQPRAAVLRYDDPLLTREVSARRHVKAVIRAVIDYVQASPLARKFCPELKGPIGPLGKNPMLATEIAGASLSLSFWPSLIMSRHLVGPVKRLRNICCDAASVAPKPMKYRTTIATQGSP